jgi:hypothetical protein
MSTARQTPAPPPPQEQQYPPQEQQPQYPPQAVQHFPPQPQQQQYPTQGKQQYVSQLHHQYPPQDPYDNPLQTPMQDGDFSEQMGALKLDNGSRPFPVRTSSHTSNSQGGSANGSRTIPNGPLPPVPRNGGY